MKRTYGDWDFGGNSILRVRIHPGDTFYGTPEEGQVMYHLGLKGLYVWDGTSWRACSVGSITLDDLADVDTSAAASAKQVLSFVPATTGIPSHWIARQLSLSDMAGVNLTGATNGQVLKLVSGTWTPSDIPQALPLGGSTGQILAKLSGTNGDAGWVSKPIGVPTGGAVGQVLTKNSTTDGDTTWATPSISGTMPSGGATGQVLVKKSAADSDAMWVLGSDVTTLDSSAHRYWKIDVLDVTGAVGNRIRFSELAFLKADGTTLTPAAGSSTANIYWDVSTYNVSRLYDGSVYSDVWLNVYSPFPSGVPIIFDYGPGNSINAVTVRMSSCSDTATMAAQTPKSFKVYYSDDGATWTLKWTVSSTGTWTTGQTKVFPAPASPNSFIPRGGSTGQVLAKLSTTDGDATWTTPVSVPSGGTVGQVLTKNSAVDGDASWATPASGGGSGGGSVSVGAHKYWRLKNMQVVGDASQDSAGWMRNCKPSQIALRASVGGAAQIPTSAYSLYSSNISALYDGVGMTPVQLSSDGGNPSGRLVVYQYTTAVSVAEVAIQKPSGGTGTSQQQIIAFDIEYSDDGLTWTYVCACSTSTTTPYTDSVAVNQTFAVQTTISGGGGGSSVGSHRYWMLDNLSVPSGGLSIAEVAMRSTPGGANLTISSAAAKDYYDSSTTPSKAIDGNAGTCWAAATSTGFIYFDLGSAKAVQEIVVTARNDGWHQQRPTRIDVMYSDDAIRWTRVAAYTYPQETVSGASITLSVPTTL